MCEIFFVILHAFSVNVKVTCPKRPKGKKKNQNIIHMKKTILMLTAAVTMVLSGCKESPYINAPGDESNNTGTLPEIADPDPTPDPEGVTIPEGTLTVNEAVKLGKKLASGAASDKEYFIKGWVRRFDETQRGKSDFESKFEQYGNDYAYLSARNDGKGSKEFYCYRILGPNGAKFPDHDALQIGDFVVVRCKIQNYNGIIENEGTCATQASSNPHFNEVFAEALLPADTIRATCAEAKAAALALPNNNEPGKDIYIIEGYVQKDGYNASVSHGQQIFWVDDTKEGSKVFEAYYCNVPNGEAVPVGAKVRLTGNIMKYNTTAEMKNGNVEILEAE